jgi:hypothetical protein
MKKNADAGTSQVLRYWDKGLSPVPDLNIGWRNADGNESA